MNLYGKEFSGVRLDKFLSVKLEGFSRSKIQKFIKDGAVLVNGEIVKTGYVVAADDEIYVKDLCLSGEVKSHKNFDFVFDLDVIYEGKDFFIIDKPCGMVVHGSDGRLDSNTVAGKVSLKVRKKDFDVNRPGIVHRLDKNTSGVLIVAKNKNGYDYFVDLFKNRRLEKTYIALVKGMLDYKEGVIEAPLGRSVFNRKKMSLLSEKDGKIAISRYKVVKEFSLDKKSFVSLLEVKIETGRTHQIRVHMSSIGHPVVCDDTYGIRSFNKRFSEKYGLKRQFLHAWKIGFKDPDSEKKVTVKSELPDDLEATLKLLK